MDQYPDLETPLLIRAAQFVRDKKIEEAVELLQVSQHANLLSVQLFTLSIFALY